MMVMIRPLSLHAASTDSPIQVWLLRWCCPAECVWLLLCCCCCWRLAAAPAGASAAQAAPLLAVPLQEPCPCCNSWMLQLLLPCY
jgi:hypothetical protein